MDKWKSVLIALNNQIDSKELSNAVKEDKWDGEFEPTEDAINDIISQTKSLLTLDSALNNPDVIDRVKKEVYPVHMKTALSKVEGELKPIMDQYGVEYTKYEYINDAIGDLREALDSSVAKGDSKEIVDSYKADIAKLHEQLQAKESESENKIKEMQEQYAQRELYRTFVSKANQYKWADAYEDDDLKEALLNRKWDKINAKAHLKLNDSGDILLYQKDLPEKELYEGNKVKTFQSLLEPELQPYLKKSNPERVVSPPSETPSDADNLTPNMRKMLEHRERVR